MGIIVKFASGKYRNDDAVSKVVNYILNKDSRDINGYNIYGSLGTYHNSIKGIVNDFNKVKEIFEQTDGVLIKHMIISFSSPPSLSRKQIEKKILRTLRFFSNDYQLVYAIHENTDDFHIHIGINSVSYRNGKKFDIRAKHKRIFDKYVKKIWNDYLA